MKADMQASISKFAANEHVMVFGFRQLLQQIQFGDNPDQLQMSLSIDELDAHL